MSDDEYDDAVTAMYGERGKPADPIPGDGDDDDDDGLPMFVSGDDEDGNEAESHEPRPASATTTGMRELARKLLTSHRSVMQSPPPQSPSPLSSLSSLSLSSSSSSSSSPTKQSRRLGVGEGKEELVVAEAEEKKGRERKIVKPAARPAVVRFSPLTHPFQSSSSSSSGRRSGGGTGGGGEGKRSGAMYVVEEEEDDDEQEGTALDERADTGRPGLGGPLKRARWGALHDGGAMVVAAAAAPPRVRFTPGTDIERVYNWVLLLAGLAGKSMRPDLVWHQSVYNEEKACEAAGEAYVGPHGEIRRPDDIGTILHSLSPYSEMASVITVEAMATRDRFITSTIVSRFTEFDHMTHEKTRVAFAMLVAVRLCDVSAMFKGAWPKGTVSPMKLFWRQEGLRQYGDLP